MTRSLTYSFTQLRWSADLGRRWRFETSRERASRRAPRIAPGGPARLRQTDAEASGGFTRALHIPC